MDVMILHAKNRRKFCCLVERISCKRFYFFGMFNDVLSFLQKCIRYFVTSLAARLFSWKTISFVVGYLCVWGRKRVRDSYQNSQHKNCFEKASRGSTQTTIWSWTWESTHDTMPRYGKGVRNFLPGFPFACTISSQVWFWHLLCPYINLVGWYCGNLLLSNLVNFPVHIFSFSPPFFLWIIRFFNNKLGFTFTLNSFFFINSLTPFIIIV